MENNFTIQETKERIAEFDEFNKRREAFVYLQALEEYLKKIDE
jgi:hypothetical protein